MPDTLQSRSIVGYLQRAKPSDTRERLRHGRTEQLIECKRKFARWAQNIRSLPEVPMIEEFANRLGDNWENLFRIAAAAGGEWPARALAAARAAVAGAPADTSEFIALLDAVWTAFYEKRVVRMHTGVLVNALLELDEGQWARANGGKGIDAYYLKEHLSTVITVNTPALKKARRWREGKGSTKYGYTEEHLADAFIALHEPGPPVEGSDAEEAYPHQTPLFHPTHPTHPTHGRKMMKHSNSYSASDSASDGANRIRQRPFAR